MDVIDYQLYLLQKYSSSFGTFCIFAHPSEDELPQSPRCILQLDDRPRLRRWPDIACLLKRLSVLKGDKRVKKDITPVIERAVNLLVAGYNFVGYQQSLIHFLPKLDYQV